MTLTEGFTIAGAIAGIIFTAALLIGGIGYFWSAFTGGKNQKQSEADRLQEKVDQQLKDLVDTHEKRYNILDNEHRKNLQEIGKLQGMVAEQTKQQQWFESIFIDALKLFFKENPALARELNDRVQKTKKP